MSKFFCALVFAGFSLPFNIIAQGKSAAPAKKDSAFVEIAAFGAAPDARLPFWLHTNQWGTVPKNGNGGAVRAGWAGTYNFNSNKDGLRFIGGIEAVENFAKEAKFLLPEAYAGLRLGNFEIFAGRRKEQIGLADSTIGTGSYTVSGNALPHFRLQIGFYKFTNVPFTNGWLQFLATYSDGIMDRNRPVVTDLRLHQKQLYLRLGKPNGLLRFYGGFNHVAQWGGKSPYYFDPKNPASKQMPRGFKTYWEMVTGTRMPLSSADIHDATNRIGNHLGSIDVGLEIRTYGADILMYRQSLYEDGSLISLINIADGLNGIKIKKNNIYGSAIEIHEAVVEFLYTKSQGGAEFEIADPKLRGRDNYFNNYQVRDGWSYQMRTIGTPFITPGVDTKNLGAQYQYGDSFTNNNRVWATHLGLKGSIANKIKWTTKLSYSRNYGVYQREEYWPEKGFGQFSGMLSLSQYTNWIGGMTVGLNLAADYGEFYEDSYGAMISLRKHLNF